jgi:outer membrane autotransporter protein
VAYSLASQTNFELNYAAQGTYNDRIGANNDGAANQGWARLSSANVDLEGAKAFDIKQKHSFVQAGKDLLKSSADGTSNTTGVAISYGNTDNTVSNRDRLAGGINPVTGTVKATQLTLAGYHTIQKSDGSIIDLVGSISSLDNKFSDVNGTGGKQSGTGFGFSAEFAKPIEVMDGSMTVEPQVQLSYQNNSYKAFNDTVADIGAYSADSLRARIGVRLTWNDNKTASGNPSYTSQPGNFYIKANILQDLIAPQGVTIGGVNIQDDINKKTWLEVGVGGQAQLSDNATFYGSLSAQKSITGASRSAAAGNVGLKISF